MGLVTTAVLRSGLPGEDRAVQAFRIISSSRWVLLEPTRGDANQHTSLGMVGNSDLGPLGQSVLVDVNGVGIGTLAA